MLRPAQNIPIHAFYKVLLFGFLLLATSCSGSATPTSDQTPSEHPSKPSAGQITDFPASAPHLSAGQHLRFERISLEEGLSQSTVFCMLQDNQGFMWFGTEDGLNKYDGYTFTVYQHDPEDPNSLGGTRIQTMLEDDSGVLWIGTNDGGLDQYDRNRNQFIHYRHDPDDFDSLGGDEITTIYQDREGVLWIGTGGGGLDRFDQENERFIHYQNIPGNPQSLSFNTVSSIIQDQEGMLWIGTKGGGLNRFDTENEHWWHYEHDPGDPHSVSHNTITAISEDEAGGIWIGTGGGGLDKFEQENERFIHYQHDPADPESLSSDEVTAIYQDREGMLWIGTYGGGLNRFDPEKETFAHHQNVPGDPHSLSINFVVSIFQDREGVLWFGTVAGGVNKLDVGRWNFAHYQNDPNDPNSLGDNMIRGFIEDSDGTLWVGTSAGGLDRFDRQTGSWHHYRHDPADPGSLSDDWVAAIYRDHSGALWIGTRSGLDKFDPETETFTHYQADPDAPPASPGNFVRTIYEDQAGQFWIGTKGGLYRFDRKTESWSHHYRHDPDDPHSLSDDWVFSFLEDDKGRIWIGTFAGGLNRFDPEKETFVHYNDDSDDPHSLSNNLVVSILHDREGTLWVGTSGGLNRFDTATETFTHYREKDGLANDSVYCILEDEQGHLWVSTNKGLSRFDPQREAFRNYDVTDGLQSNEFNNNACLTSDSGEMFFGGINGFNTFFPDQIMDNPTIPPLVLTSLVQNGEAVDLGTAVDSLTEATFKWPDNSFEFEFAALSYAQPEKNQYAYMLEGFDEDWNETGTRRYGKYTNLPGGTYTLHLRGSNNDGVWNELGTTVQITIVPPFWSAWWFRVMAVVLLLSGVMIGYRLRVRNIEGRRRELEWQVEQRTADLMQTQEALRQSEMERAITEERNRLARDLHDSVTQSLYSLTLLAEAGQRMIKSKDLQQIEGNQTRLGEIAQQALQEMRLLVFELRPLALKSEGLIDALNHRLEAVERRAGVKAQLAVDGEFICSEKLEEELYRIAQEALNNVLKHARASEIKVSVQCSPSSLVLEVSDNGLGFVLNEAGDKGGIGLTSMRERAVRIGGTLTLQSSSGEGTRVRIEVDNIPSDQIGDGHSDPSQEQEAQS